MVIVFAMAGCGACEDYKPRFEKMVAGFQQHGVPLVWYKPGMMVLPGQIPVLIIDAASEDPSVVGLADQYQIAALPTTMLFAHNSKPRKLEGTLEDHEIHEVLASAVYASRR